MADVLEDDDNTVPEHHFGRQEWDRLEDNFINVRLKNTQNPCYFVPQILLVMFRLVIERA
jgi:hypothetical protein